MKKIKLLFTFALLSIINSVSFSQNLIEGPETPVVRGVGYQKLIGSDDTGFYVFKQSSIGKGIHIVIEKFNSNDFSLIFSKETKVAEIQESMNFAPVTQIQTFISKDKIFIFFESLNHKTDKLTFFLQTVSLSGELSEVFEISSAYLKIKNDIELMGASYFKVSFSPDGNSFATISLLEEEKQVKSYVQNNLICKIYDASTFKKTAERTIPKKDRGVSITTDNYTIDNNENLFFSVIYESNSDKKNMIGGFAIGLIENASPTVKMFPIALPDKKIFHDFAFKSLTDGDLLIAGIVSDTLDKGVDSSFLQASYFIKRIANNTLQTKYERIKDFNLDAKIVLGKAKKGTTFSNTDIMEMNNEVYITTQRTEIQYKYSSGNIISFLEAQTTNKEIIVSKIDTDGNISWTKVIPKYHIGGFLISGIPKPPRYSGNYKVFTAGNKLNFVFLDSPENQDLTPENFESNKVKPLHANIFGSESIVAKDKAAAVLVSIDANGKSKKITFLSDIEGGVHYVPMANMVMLSPKKLLVFLENRKTKIEKFASLSIQ